MDLSRALAQVAHIHDQLARADVYRGYRSVPVAASGAIGLAAAAMQPAAYGTNDPVGFVMYWTAAAAVAAAVGFSEIIYAYAVTDDPIARQRTRRVTGQFLPAFAAGVLITLSLVRLSAALVPLLPGIWAICFGIGVFASRPYLPRASGWVALYYYAVGIGLLWMAGVPQALTPWHVGATFGVGQLLAAAVLYFGLEREQADAGRDDDDEEETGR